MWLIRSTTRLLYPHLLSYHVIWAHQISETQTLIRVRECENTCQFEEVVVQSNTRWSIKNRRALVTDEI